MMNKKLKKTGISACLLFASSLSLSQASVLRDSVGVENLNGKRVILHRVESGETYYGISRRYQVDPKSLIAFNNNTSLRPGLVVKVATGKPFVENISVRPEKEQVVKASASSAANTGTDFIEYKVGSGETLFALSRKFGVSVDAIQKANSLSSSSLKAGQIVKIPNQQTASNAVVITDEDLRDDRTTNNEASTAVSVIDDRNDNNTVESVRKEEEKSFEPTNQFGLKEVSASGVGVWMDDVGNGDSGKNLALHNAAPIGTVVKITNPMNNRMAYAKVVGRFNETAQSKDAVIVISKSVASLLGVIDRRFQVKISY
ncbi:DPBB and LysM peptidoglycan-binding domain-containing protein [Olivibacter sitiensis]|uniref:DPBB and LysM peptidoglycan-binding domain-containing protein n=1 Tax=Olivibacter sitiensis TaxID=376470 RepID=UPI0006856114|nr:LysM peptidoglycan-binding domain-containing protein [Olivibacter sitiensis]